MAGNIKCPAICGANAWPTRNEITVGDAAAGQPASAQKQLFGSYGPIGGPLNVYDKVITMATSSPCDDCRPRLWHVNFYGEEIMDANAVPQLPITPGGMGSSVSRVPFPTQIQGRIQIQDASGGRFFDVDVMGTRMIEVVASSVSAYALMPSNFYEVPQVQRIGVVLETRNGYVSNSQFSVSIVPVATNASQNTDIISRRLPLTLIDPVEIITPPGSKRVSIQAPTAALAAATAANFTVGGGATIPFSLGTIIWPAGSSNTGLINMPNSYSIVIIPPAVPITYTLTYEIEP